MPHGTRGVPWLRRSMEVDGVQHRGARAMGIGVCVGLVAAACGSGTTVTARPAATPPVVTSEFPVEIRADQDAFAAAFAIPVSIAERRDERLRTEEAIARCMAEQGFEYVPFPVVVGSQESAVGGLVPHSPEFLDTYGFGHSTLGFPRRELPADVVGWAGTEMYPVDPSHTITDALSTDERKQYHVALDGPISEAGEFDIGGGCGDVARAETQMADDLVVARDELRLRFGDLVAERVVEDAAWERYASGLGDCIAEQGFAEVSAALADRLVTDPTSPWPLMGLVAPLVGESASRSLGSHRAEDFRTLRADQAVELGVADAALACAYPDYMIEYLAISRPHEREVWRTLQADLDELASRMNDR